MQDGGGNGQMANAMLLASIKRLDSSTRDLWEAVNSLRGDMAQDRTAAATHAVRLNSLPCARHEREIQALVSSQREISDTLRDRLGWKALLGKILALVVPLVVAGFVLADKVKGWLGWMTP